ncbi:flagellar biosynthesis protein FlhB [Rhodovibrio salinarum]|uniref:Flagellar biosynthetic protein FlhB n=1 Tax=Rhodovibrio salinarum TaxID=1087 RepID=A0A934QKB1_9PROT|nr:flagellar biosynthesis protein FlhB [Rhodovibrio salinarum]MBK1698416.1 flagellar biosynthesis protein FlhB [Rhodovibrio salinarum]
MSDDQTDKSQKTEDPTPKKLEEARKKGQVAKSQEVNHWFIILGLGLILTIMAPAMASGVSDTLRRFLAKAALLPTGGGLGPVLTDTMIDMLWVLLLPMGLLMIAAVAANFVQIGFLVSVESLKPKPEKISPIKGAKRLFSTRALVDFAKGIAKLTLVGLVAFLVIWPEHDTLPQLIEIGMTAQLEVLRVYALKVTGAVLAVMTVIAALDVAYQRYKHHEEMKMSKQEVKDEFKQSEGDPQVKQRLRQLRMEKSRKRMMAAVPQADVVVTNPTHYAIALSYSHGEMAAPRVVAKGVDEVARRIREVAEANDVPLVENPPLARALHASVELDQEIPAEHYKAVAEIIGYVMRLKGRMPATAGR